jgi:hypothetical protein
MLTYADVCCRMLTCDAGKVSQRSQQNKTLATRLLVLMKSQVLQEQELAVLRSRKMHALSRLSQCVCVGGWLRVWVWV